MHKGSKWKGNEQRQEREREIHTHTWRENVSCSGTSSVPVAGRGISLERRKRWGVFMDTATSREGRLGSRFCWTCNRVTVSAHNLKKQRNQRFAKLLYITPISHPCSHLVTQLCGILRTSHVDNSCILAGSAEEWPSVASSPASSISFGSSIIWAVTRDLRWAYYVLYMYSSMSITSFPEPLPYAQLLSKKHGVGRGRTRARYSVWQRAPEACEAPQSYERHTET